MKKFIITLLIFCCSAMIAHAGTFKADAKTKRIAAGTVFQLEFTQPVSTYSGAEGDYFTAILKNELTAEASVILPQGSIVRGSISNVNSAKRFSRGAKLYLDFDHVVTPNGRQVPLSLTVTGRTDVTYDGGITTTKGYRDAWRKTCTKSADITRKSVNWGKGVTDNGFKYVVIPASAVGGAVGTAGYFVYGSAADAIRKGKDVKIQKNDVIDVVLTEPVDAPVI